MNEQDRKRALELANEIEKAECKAHAALIGQDLREWKQYRIIAADGYAELRKILEGT